MQNEHKEVKVDEILGREEAEKAIKEAMVSTCSCALASQPRTYSKLYIMPCVHASCSCAMQLGKLKLAASLPYRSKRML